MNIPDPKAQYRDDVEVLNYRKRPAVWERGTVLHAPKFTLGCDVDIGSWSYEIQIVRSVEGQVIQRVNLTVGDDGIRKPE